MNKYVYLPTPHSWHALVPVTSEYFPAPQSKHANALDAPSVARYLPAAQALQALAEDAPALAEYVPAGQVSHVNSEAGPPQAQSLAYPEKDPLHVDCFVDPC